MFGVYSDVVLTCVIALVVGAAAAGSGPRAAWSGRAPALGIAVMLLVCSLAVRLPGHGTSAAFGLVVAALAGVLVARRRGAGRVPTEVLTVGILTLAMASLPFLANGRVEALGQSFNEDFAFHLDWAWSLVRQGDATDLAPAGYPLAPHALAGTVGVLTGAGVQAGFLGLLLAVPVLTALAALGALDVLPGRLRIVAAVMVGLPYLAAAYLAQGAFKEPIMALLTLGCVLCLRDLDRRRITATRAAGELTLLSAAALYSFSFAGLAWPAMAVGCYLALSLARSRRIPRFADLRPALAPALVAGAALGLAVALESSRLLLFFSSPTGKLGLGGGGGGDRGGNFVGQISPAEVLGVWPSEDFRLRPLTDTPWWRAAVLLAAVVALWGAVRWARRRDPLVPAAAAGALVLYFVARETTIPYVSAKALVVAAPLVMLVSLGWLLGAEPSALGRRLGWGAVAAVVLVSTSVSSAMTLRAARVRGGQGARDLRELRGRVAGSSVLFLARDAFVAYDLRGARLSTVGFPLPQPVSEVRIRPAKRGPAPTAADFDSIEPAALARFRYVVTPRGALASTPPRSFRAVHANRTYVLWRRVGPMGPRSVLPDEGDAPGAVLRCGPRGRRAAGRGIAATRPAPVTGSLGAWRRVSGSRALRIGLFSVGSTETRWKQVLRLHAGPWRLYLQYTSPAALEVTAGAARATLPAHLTDLATMWPAGRVEASGGRLTVTVRVRPGNVLARDRFALLGRLIAAPVGPRPRELPIGRACGRYVDWLRPGLG